MFTFKIHKINLTVIMLINTNIFFNAGISEYHFFYIYLRITAAVPLILDSVH